MQKSSSVRAHSKFEVQVLQFKSKFSNHAKNSEVNEDEQLQRQSYYFNQVLLKPSFQACSCAPRAPNIYDTKSVNKDIVEVKKLPRFFYKVQRADLTRHVASIRLL